MTPPSSVQWRPFIHCPAASWTMWDDLVDGKLAKNIYIYTEWCWNYLMKTNLNLVWYRCTIGTVQYWLLWHSFRCAKCIEMFGSFPSHPPFAKSPLLRFLSRRKVRKKQVEEEVEVETKKVAVVLVAVLAVAVVAAALSVLGAAEAAGAAVVVAVAVVGSGW